MKKQYSHYLIILVVCLLAFYQVAFFLESIKWDNLDSYLPVRYFVSECLHYGIFPLWLPYQGLGCPIFGDLISTNYPEAVFLGRLLHYDNIVMQLVFMIYIFLTGIGFYQLSRSLKIKPEISLILSVAYALSGFIVGHAQHIQYLISAAWIPFILKYYLQLTSFRKIPVLLKFILFTYLQVSGGYPAHTIFLIYLLAFLFIVRLLRLLLQKNRNQIPSFTAANFIALIVLGVMCFGIFLSIRQSSADISRYKGMSYEMTTLNPFTPQCLVSLISPLTPATSPQFFGTDLSMNNLYFGVIVLVFFIYGITRPLTNKSTLFLVTGIVSLLIAMGPYFFLHKLAFNFLPLFKAFRHPGNLRLFVILSFLLVTGLQYMQHPLTDDKNLIRFKRILLIFMGFLLLVMISSATAAIIRSTPAEKPDLTITSLVRGYGMAVPLFLQSSLGLLFIGLLYLALFVFTRIPRMPSVILLVVAEMFLFTQLNAPYTVYYRNSDPAGLNKFLRHRPEGFPLPDHHMIGENTDRSVAFKELWVNTNTYAKTVSLDIFYPFVPDGIIRLQEDTALLSGSLNHPLLFLAEKVYQLSQRESYAYNAATDSRTVFVPDKVFNTLYLPEISIPFTRDTVFPLQVTPSLIEAEVYLTSSRVCLMLQNNYPGWKVFIDDRETVHFSVNHTLIGIKVPPGHHRIRYEFRNPAYVRATLFSFSLFLVILYLVSGYVISEHLITKRYAVARWMISAIPLGLLLFFLVRPRISYAGHQHAASNALERTIDSMMIQSQGSSSWLLLNAEKADLCTGVKTSHGCLHQRFRTYDDLVNVWNVLDTLRAERVIYAWSNVIELPEIQEIIRLRFPVITRQFKSERMAVISFSKGSDDAEVQGTLLFNDFENPYPGWTYDRSSLDSMVVYSGRYADRLSQGREFGSTFRTRIDQVPDDGIRIFSALRFQRMGDKSFHLVIEVRRDNHTLYYHAVDLTSFCTDDLKWNTGFALLQCPEHRLQKGDEVSVYCWNSGKNEALYTDDHQIRIE